MVFDLGGSAVSRLNEFFGLERGHRKRFLLLQLQLLLDLNQLQQILHSPLVSLVPDHTFESWVSEQKHIIVYLVIE